MFSSALLLILLVIVSKQVDADETLNQFNNSENQTDIQVNQGLAVATHQRVVQSIQLDQVSHAPRVDLICAPEWF